MRNFFMMKCFNFQTELKDEKVSVRDLLKKMVENRSKELTVKSVVENLLQQNEIVLAQNDAQALKPNSRTVKPKVSTDIEMHGSIITPKDPTAGCSREDMPAINDALVEVTVKEANESNCDPDLVCAVGSKVMLMTPEGQPLHMDITYYWCNFCCYKSEKKSTLLQHVMEHRFHCKYCKFQSFSRAAVIHHCTEEHQNFKETASTLKYCTYLPDLLQKNNMKKRQQDGGGDGPSAKRKRLSESEPLHMETEEADSEKQTSFDAVKDFYPSQMEEVNSLVGNDADAGEANDGLPVISSVMSGQKAVSAILTSTKDSESDKAQKQSSSTHPAPGVTVSSGLCWNCGYCAYVTLSQSFLKIHLNAHHQGKPHRYVALLVSSEEEMARIKASDAGHMTGPTDSSTIVAVTPVTSSSLPSTPTGPTSYYRYAPISKQPSGIEIDNAENETPVEEKSDEKKIPVSFKCAHCNFSAPLEEKVKFHLFQRHSGCVIYALDMKAVKLRQKRYIFFCLKTKCSFKTKETDEYLEHISTCTPWLDGTTENVDKGMVKSLELTKTFIEKTANAMGIGKDTRSEKLAEYACIYCSYVSNNNTRMKKHVLSNHTDKVCIIKDIPASKGNKKCSVYFCSQCLWETREGSELEIHLSERHNITKAKTHQEQPHEIEKCTTSDESDGKQTSAADGTAESEKKTPPASRKKHQARARSEGSGSVVSEPDAYKSDNEESKGVSDAEENEYDGIVPADIYERAMAAYIASENSEISKVRGRPSRNAALKCRIKVKSIKAPPLYKCMHCSEIHFGTNLMRAHLQKKHKNQPLRSIDVLKQDKKSPNFYTCFCPVDKCTFFEAVATDVVNHAKNRHGISATHKDLVRLMDVYLGPQTSPAASSRTGRPASASTGESYECLYCNESKLYHSRKDMKKHLIDQHGEDEFIFRDCIARKLRQPSRYYMCHNLLCDFTTEKQKDYLLHMLGHQKAKIYECSRCQWFTSLSEEIHNHYKNVHNETGITTLEIDLDLDAMGNTLKLVGGQVIKSER